MADHTEPRVKCFWTLLLPCSFTCCFIEALWMAWQSGHRCKKQILYSAAGVCARRTQFDTRGLECQAKDRPAGLLFQTCWFQFVCWSRRCGPCSSCIVACNQNPCGFDQHVCEKEATAIWEGNQWVWFFLRGIAKGFDYSAADVLFDQKRRQLMLHIIYLRPG